ncbi:unnamed protein product [Leptidea sinapis]|uniref:Uncharacterized protein n=1 Tax=Leptidea sinapis TaxID=189913 RepID=A0A5E4PS60_9NEOP|nr:unnamed protein product [Leptidea sinapis]
MIVVRERTKEVGLLAEQNRSQGRGHGWLPSICMEPSGESSGAEVPLSDASMSSRPLIVPGTRNKDHSLHVSSACVWVTWTCHVRTNRHAQ